LTSRRRVAKRAYDLVFAGTGLVLLSPLFLLLAVLVKLSDGGPVLYRQERVGLGGCLFRIWKFRSMVVNADRIGIAVTRDGDPRITPIGRFLRKTKLDELPQLWNVFVGDMSLVGPRPEVPKYVERYTPEQRVILQLKPGITDLATLRFRNEEELLREAKNTERFYLEHCVPRKIELNLEYARRAGLWADTMIILRTLFPVVDRRFKRD
jgi:lipopolysaccharide/colanic/teichoic acid biosynthesis glycosyltransferase